MKTFVLLSTLFMVSFFNTGQFLQSIIRNTINVGHQGDFSRWNKKLDHGLQHKSVFSCFHLLFRGYYISNFFFLNSMPQILLTRLPILQLVMGLNLRLVSVSMSRTTLSLTFSTLATHTMHTTSTRSMIAEQANQVSCLLINFICFTIDLVIPYITNLCHAIKFGNDQLSFTINETEISYMLYHMFHSFSEGNLLVL